MRMMIALVLALVGSSALADDVDEAHRQAPDRVKTMSEQDFVANIASACPSERQNFRVSLIDYLSMKFPDAESGQHLSTANRAIELAQKDIVTAFVRRKAAPN